MFSFKQFNIEDNGCAMKVGTDGVLLGAWTNIRDVKHILDVGTGSGLIALMLAQRTSNEVIIDAIEIDEACAHQASFNIAQSPWASKVLMHTTSLQQFETLPCYDLIVCNPPYFNNSFAPPQSARAVARHANTLSHAELASHTKRLLSPTGKLSVILPFAEGKQFMSFASMLGFVCSRQCAVHSRPNKPQERWLLEFSLEYQPLKAEQLILHSSNDEWSDDYKNLTQQFYLKI